ncbi:23S rRNA (adenine(2030)-N(6))-methyltransferase [Psychrosphaera haliotis]|uniref:23S rRNA (adenine(2030)-N(6))-methyltransferase RlmJ n=1 Tax=Psychrosphaera haliotis TaxID=555083 RepID=UPI0031D8B845
MLSYRHGFHAGNHADVLKHTVYQLVLKYLGKKNKPYSIIDTHAGAGAYQLMDEFGQKNKEYNTGIGKLWSLDSKTMPEPLQDYVSAVRRFNSESEQTDLNVYPGSPWFALDELPLEGKGFFHELHPSDFELLRTFVRTNRYRKVIKGDGFKESVGLFPPPSRRGVAIIDPPYELKEDYHRVVEYVTAMTSRFESGVYMIWYPVVDRYRIDGMEHALKKSGIKDIQVFELNVLPDTDERGMTGSGMIVINAPYTLKEQMSEVLLYLDKQLGEQGSSWRSEQLVEE